MTDTAEKPIVLLGGALPAKIQGAFFVGSLYRKGSCNREWHRDLYKATDGFYVHEWTLHDLLPDATVGWLMGPYTRSELLAEIPEYNYYVQG